MKALSRRQKKKNSSLSPKGAIIPPEQSLSRITVKCLFLWDQHVTYATKNTNGWLQLLRQTKTAIIHGFLQKDCATVFLFLSTRKRMNYGERKWEEIFLVIICLLTKLILSKMGKITDGLYAMGLKYMTVLLIPCLKRRRLVRLAKLRPMRYLHIRHL